MGVTTVYKLEYNNKDYIIRKLILLKNISGGFCWIHDPADNTVWVESSVGLFQLREEAIRAEIDRLHQERKLINKKLKALWSMPDAF